MLSKRNFCSTLRRPQQRAAVPRRLCQLTKDTGIIPLLAESPKLGHATSPLMDPASIARLWSRSPTHQQGSNLGQEQITSRFNAMSIRDTTISTGQADQLDEQPADKVQENISKQLELLLSRFAEFEKRFNAIEQDNADFKEKSSANEQQKAEFKEESSAKSSTQVNRPDTASELIVRNGAPQTSTLTLMSLHEEVLIDEVNNN